MILLCGIPSEPPLQLVTAALEQLRQHYFLFNQRHVGQTEVEFTVRDGVVKGWLESGNARYRLEDFEGVYLRFMDDGELPEIRHEPAGSPARTHSRAVHETLNTWLELTEARVLNRPSAMCSNNSKPFQAQLIEAHGLRVPETLITNDPDLVREFRREHGRVIYKSISGVRSIVQSLEDKDLERIEKIRWCPTQFQQFIEGTNVRVHVVGRKAFATRVQSDAVDYRYAQRQVGESADLEACDLCADTAERCVAVAEALELPFAGIDLKITPAGEVYCFEVNPCPGFSYYELSAGQPIAMAVAEYLSGRAAVDGPARVHAVAPGGG
jgi:glutathione synthase/RimK-type ligase-like ATP-grasp enzyme